MGLHGGWGDCELVQMSHFLLAGFFYIILLKARGPGKGGERPLEDLWGCRPPAVEMLPLYCNAMFRVKVLVLNIIHHKVLVFVLNIMHLKLLK